MSKIISGFSKFSKDEKVDWLLKNYFKNAPEALKIIQQYWNDDENLHAFWCCS